MLLFVALAVDQSSRLKNTQHSVCSLIISYSFKAREWKHAITRNVSVGRTSTMRKPVEHVTLVAHTLKAAWGVHTSVVTGPLKEALVNIYN